MYKPQIPNDTSEALKRKRLHNAGDLAAHRSPMAQSPAKENESEKIARETEEFLSSGGVIEQIEPGESNYDGGKVAFVIKSHRGD